MSDFHVKQRQIARTLVTGYVTDSENEKHRHVGLDIMIEMLADKKRLHKSYSKRFQLAESRDEMYQR